MKNSNTINNKTAALCIALVFVSGFVCGSGFFLLGFFAILAGGTALFTGSLSFGRGMLLTAFLILSSGISYFLFGRALYALLPFLIAFFGASLIICDKLSASPTVRLIASSITFAVSYAAYGAVLLYGSFGSFEKAYTEINGAVNSAYAQSAEMLEEMLKTSGVDYEASQLFSPELLSQMKHYFLMLSPGLFFALCTFAVYITMLITKTHEKASGRVRISVPASVIYLAAYTVDSFAQTESAFVYSAINLMLVIMPFAFIEGIYSLFSKGGLYRSPGKRFMKISFLVLCGIMLLSYPQMIFTFIGMWGALSAIFGAVNKKISDNINQK